MTGQRWRRSLYAFLLWYGAFWYATHHIHNAWGLFILAGLYISGFWLVVQTVDLLCGRWLRQGARPAPGTRVRRVIVEEVEY